MCKENDARCCYWRRSKTPTVRASASSFGPPSPSACMSARLHCALSCPLHSREGIQPPRLRLVLASATPARVHEREKALRLSITLCSREAEQPTRLRLVLGSATPVRVHERESALRFSITLHSREAEQPPRLRIDLGSAAPLRMHERETTLRLSITLRSREAEQPPRLRLVLGSADPLRVQEPESELRLSITLRSIEAKQPPRLHMQISFVAFFGLLAAPASAFNAGAPLRAVSRAGSVSMVAPKGPFGGRKGDSDGRLYCLIFGSAAPLRLHGVSSGGQSRPVSRHRHQCA